jgi:HSP20 family protein
MKEITTRKPVEPAGLLPAGFFDKPMFDAPFFKELADEMDRFFGEFGLKARMLPTRVLARQAVWVPEIEVQTEGDRLMVRADLPGLKPEDVHVEVTEDLLVIKGERKRIGEEKKEGFYRSERVYGAFERAVPLPEGAIHEDARAVFANGVLEVTVPIPPPVSRTPKAIKVETDQKVLSKA